MQRLAQMALHLVNPTHMPAQTDVTGAFPPFHSPLLKHLVNADTRGTFDAFRYHLHKRLGIMQYHRQQKEKSKGCPEIRDGGYAISSDSTTFPARLLPCPTSSRILLDTAEG